jgi:nicotinamide-nucleotide amidase
LLGRDLERKAEEIVRLYSERGLKIVTAESCTGGLVAGCLTAIAGSSAVLERGFVTYSNEAKIELLSVPAELIATLGAVSAETAAAMAHGALAHSRADIAVSVTGIAGPGGGSAEKPVGLVHFACAVRDEKPKLLQRRFGEIGRAGIRQKSVEVALDLLAEAALTAPGRP